MNCLFIHFKYRSSRNVAVKCGQLFDNVQRAVCFNQRDNRVDRMPSIAKKRPLRNKYRRQFLSSFQKTKSLQISGSVFAEIIEQVRGTKYELELKKSVECFLEGYDSQNSNLLTSEIKPLYAYHATRRDLKM